MCGEQILGEDPLQTEADSGLVRCGFEALDLVVVQDVCMTQTAEQIEAIDDEKWAESSVSQSYNDMKARLRQRVDGAVKATV